MTNFVARKILPRFIRNTLWGDREQWGLAVDGNDPQWHKWQETYGEFYLANQREGIGTVINDAGYSVMTDINLTRKTVLEIGAGDIRHLKYWADRTRPDKYLLADISIDMMRLSTERLKAKGISYETLMLQREQPLPLESESVDVIISFYSLEHLYPLAPYLDEMLRVLKPGGTLIGAIPAEGGLAWGVGRALTSRRWFKKNTTIDPDKIICWEHPNYADDILYELDGRMERQRVSYWPLRALPLLDANLIIQYQYRRV
jgi:SAM-dependent methyltransferase